MTNKPQHRTKVSDLKPQQLPQQTLVDTKAVLDPEVNPRWWKFITLISNLTGASGAVKRHEAYKQAFDCPEMTDDVAWSMVTRLIRNDEFKKTQILWLQAHGMNQESLDTQLFKLAMSEDPNISIKALSEFNKIMGRNVQKVDHTTNGKDLPTPILGTPIIVSDDNSSTEDN